MIRKIIAALLIGASAISALDDDTTAIQNMVNGLLNNAELIASVQGLLSSIGDKVAIDEDVIQGFVSNIEHAVADTQT